MFSKLARGIESLGFSASSTAQGHGSDQLYKMLLIGETGSGKTCNAERIQAVGFADASKGFRPFTDIKLENAEARQMQSKTSGAKLFVVLVGVIDTPGFGDSRGLKENAGEIVRALSSEDYVNCICLTINGRESRMSASMSCLRSLPSYFDRSFVTSDLLHHLPGEAAKRKILGHGTTQRKIHIVVGIGDLSTGLKIPFQRTGVIAFVDSSPNDPVFLNHHTMVDCIIEEWLQRYGDSISYPHSSGIREGHRAWDYIIELFMQKDMLKTADNFGYSCYLPKKADSTLYNKTNVL